MRLAYIPIFILLFLLGVFTVGLYKEDITGTAMPKETRLMGHQFPDFKLESYEGADFQTSDLKGKYSIVNIFASWCLSCKLEHKNLIYLKENYGVDIYGINWRDEHKKLKGYLENVGNPYKKIGIDANGELIIQLGTRGIPETYVVDPHGKIVFYQPGLLEEKTAMEIGEKIKARKF